MIEKVVNFLTVDVEDYFQVEGFQGSLTEADWEQYEIRFPRGLEWLLQILDSARIKATFFILGWIAEHCRPLVRDIDRRGHEVASHGYRHNLISGMKPEDYRKDLLLSKDLLEDITGTPVIGHRAASYSIIRETLWALDVLIEEGFLYDSSIFPIRHDLYGIPDAKRFPHVIERSGGSIIEFPPSTYPLLGQQIPVAGGGYLRLFPSRLTRAAIKRINEKEKNLAVVYCHPWEIDTSQPRLNGKWKSMLRHYINLDTTMPKLRGLLEEFKFRPFGDLLRDGGLSLPTSCPAGISGPGQKISGSAN